jgi:hypothetical protein
MQSLICLITVVRFALIPVMFVIYTTSRALLSF